MTQVAPISHSVLILIYTPITPAGSPAIVASAAKEAIAPPGTPGVPTERSTFARRMITIIEMLTLIPHAFAKNMIIKDIRIDTASIFTVAPRGIAILVILLETPIPSSIHCLLIGIVAELEQVPKAFSAAGIIVLKKRSGLSLPITLTARPYTTNAKIKNARYRMISCVASEMIVSDTVGLYNRNDCTEDTDRSKVHDRADDLQTDFVQGVDHL